MANTKRANGRYYTQGNPFNNAPFKEWAGQAGLPDNRILEPFAGSDSLIKLLSGMNLCHNSTSYDITPYGKDVRRKDTLSHFPRGYDICVTNPPWLAKNSATVRGLAYPECDYDDIYKLALERCLQRCQYIAALVPESFITADIFQDRLKSFVSLTAQMFAETQHPVGLALFVPDSVYDVDIWSGDRHIGLLSLLKKLKPEQQQSGINVRFNDPDGNVGLIALDNTKEGINPVL